MTPAAFARSVQRNRLILILLPVLGWSTETFRWYSRHSTGLALVVAFVQPLIAGWLFVWAGRIVARSGGLALAVDEERLDATVTVDGPS